MAVGGKSNVAWHQMCVVTVERLMKHMQWTKMAFISADSLSSFFEEFILAPLNYTKKRKIEKSKFCELRYACLNWFAYLIKHFNSFRVTA